MRACALNFQLTFIHLQPMHLLVIDFGLVHNAPQSFIYPFVCPPTCTTLGLTRAHNHAKWVSWVESVSPGGVESVSPGGVESVSPGGVERMSPRMQISYADVPPLPNPTPAELTHTSPPPPETNIRYHSNHALSRIRETHAKRMSGVDSTSPHGAHPGVLSDTPTVCVTQNVNCPYIPPLPNPTPADITRTSS